MSWKVSSLAQKAESVCGFFSLLTTSLACFIGQCKLSTDLNVRPRTILRVQYVLSPTKKTIPGAKWPVYHFSGLNEGQGVWLC